MRRMTCGLAAHLTLLAAVLGLLAFGAGAAQASKTVELRSEGVSLGSGPIRLIGKWTISLPTYGETIACENVVPDVSVAENGTTSTYISSTPAGDQPPAACGQGTFVYNTFEKSLAKKKPKLPKGYGDLNYRGVGSGCAWSFGRAIGTETTSGDLTMHFAGPMIVGEEFRGGCAGAHYEAQFSFETESGGPVEIFEKKG